MAFGGRNPIEYRNMFTVSRLGPVHTRTQACCAVSGVCREQGLNRLGTAPRTSYGRTVQDESYFLGSLRTKVAELTKEIAKLQREITQLERDEGSYNSYEKRAEGSNPSPPPKHTPPLTPLHMFLTAGVHV